MDFDAVEEAQVLVGVGEHRPLLAIEVSADGEGQAGDRVELPRVENLDPHVGGAVGLRPVDVARVEGVTERTGQGRAGGDRVSCPRAALDVVRPLGGVEAVPMEQRQGNSVDAEGHAGAVGHLPVIRLDPEGVAEVVPGADCPR